MGFLPFLWRDEIITILDELLEKKDLRLYLLTRLKHITTTFNVRDYEPELRDIMTERIKGRTSELKYLLKLLNQDRIKEVAKIQWNKVDGLNECPHHNLEQKKTDIGLKFGIGIIHHYWECKKCGYGSWKANHERDSGNE